MTEWVIVADSSPLIGLALHTGSGGRLPEGRMESKTKGVWLIHHMNKLRHVTSVGDFDNIHTAGKLGVLLSASSLTTVQVNAIAKSSSISALDGRDRREPKEAAVVLGDVGRAHVMLELILSGESLEEAVQVWIAALESAPVVGGTELANRESQPIFRRARASLGWAAAASRSA